MRDIYRKLDVLQEMLRLMSKILYQKEIGMEPTWQDLSALEKFYNVGTLD